MTKKRIKLKHNSDNEIIKDLSRLFGKYMKQLLKAAKLKLKILWTTKIHKSVLLKNAIEAHISEIIRYAKTLDLKLRPIVGRPKYPMCKLSNFIDILLKSFLKYIPSYIKDGLDFLNKCQRESELKTIIAIFDVVSLYTGITQDLGLKSTDFFLTNFSNDFFKVRADIHMTSTLNIGGRWVVVGVESKTNIRCYWT